MQRKIAQIKSLISYKRILAISAPIMLGSAAQNVVALTDSVFLYYVSEVDFAAIGFVGVFYLIIAAIGYGFSKGAQIFVARMQGKGDSQGVRRHFQTSLILELLLSTLLFFLVYNYAGYIFSWFVQSENIMERSLNYIQWRIWGIWFGYLGIALVSFYTGLARTKFILVDTVILATVNIFFNYSLIFGKFDLPQMGIAGAGLASTLSEIVAFVAFVLYMLWDKELKPLQLMTWRGFDWGIFLSQIKLSMPIVVHLLVGLGSWFIFFSIVENIGAHALAISNLARMVYLCLSIPVWGYSSAINTLVSSYIGEGRKSDILPLIWKTGRLALWSVLLFALPVLLFPHFFLYPLLGSASPGLIDDAKPVLVVVGVILFFMAVASVFFNGLTGTGATRFGLWVQLVNAVIYTVLIYSVVNHWQLSLVWAWSVEIIYWLLTLIVSIWYITSERWHRIEL
ncbi:MAG TPA: MATE family efflux transporter [Saprospiraceae bacterium]|nr:MATE family efflux transporter [Saprospiraceae bacterium]